MGVDIQIDGKDVYVKGNGLYGLKRPEDILDVGNSGTTIRLMMGILAGNKFDATLIGDDSIAKRPMKRVTDPLKLMGCNIGTLPHTYLGLPLSTSKPNVVDYVPMLQRIENRLLSCSTLLSTGDKLTLIKTVFTSMPTFFMCTLSLPKTVVKQINMYLKHCF